MALWVAFCNVNVERVVGRTFRVVFGGVVSPVSEKGGWPSTRVSSVL